MLAQTHIKQQLDALRHDKAYGLVRVRVAMEVDSFLGWLNAQTLYPRIYWHARGDDKPQYVALGCIRELTEPEQIQQIGAHGNQDESPRYYGGLAFDPEQHDWPGFGPCRFVLPRVELIRRGECVSLCLNLWFDEGNREAELTAALSALTALQPEAPLPSLQPQQWQRHDSPDFPQWQRLVATVTAPAFQTLTPKVVLSRESRLEGASVNPWSLLASWALQAEECFQFGFQFEPDEAFIACSPERLYRREQRHLYTEALAGTIRRSGDEMTDAQLAAELLGDGKNRLENRLVHADILQRLAPLTHDASLTEPRVLKLRLLQHLKCDIEAELHPEVSDGQLLAALHPTPAVGGAPREAALRFIRDHEPHARGWYAGACGMLSRETSEFSVAIRSALVRPHAVTLFAGAGIVAGSEPAAEWAELDNKIANVLSLLG
jgi:menaquinone-specific isochorismate synthase